jgi:cytochrome c556
VNLYIKNHPGVSAEFIILGDRFYNATNRLILSCKERDAEIADAQFDKMIKSCDACHEGYKEKDNESDE